MECNGKGGDSVEEFVDAVRAQAEEYKTLGNNLFKESHYGAACEAYSKAIERLEGLPSSESRDSLHLYLCNRALCHIKQENFGK